jgi:type IV pilus assembly protein PilM
MWEFAASRPRLCVKIGAQAMAWVEASRNWRGRRRYRCLLSPTPTGAVKLTPVELNLTDVAGVENRLRSFTGPHRDLRVAGHVVLADMPRPITLLLPDLSVRTTVVHLEQFPDRPEEQEALLRWRLGQEQLFSLAGAKVFWQVFPPERPDHHGTYAVLVVAIQEAVLNQYETVCESAGLVTQEIGVCSLRLFNLWLKASRGRRLDRDLLWVSLLDGGLTCLILHEGRLVFVRTKRLEGEPVPLDEEAGVECADRIVKECAASLYACQEYHPKLAVKHVVYASDHSISALDTAFRHELDVSTEQCDWEHVEQLGWMPNGGSTSLAAFPVLAGVI